MKNLKEAKELAQNLVNTGNSLGMKTTALLTRMDSPLGRKVGNSLEVIESLQCLRGEGPSDLQQLVVELGNNHK